MISKQDIKNLAYNYLRFGELTNNYEKFLKEIRKRDISVVSAAKNEHDIRVFFDQNFHSLSKEDQLFKALFLYAKNVHSVVGINDDDIYEMIMEMDSTKLSWQKWDRLRYVYDYNSANVIGCAFRNKAKEALEIKKGNASIINRYSMYIEDGEYEKAKELCYQYVIRLLKRIGPNVYGEMIDGCETYLGNVHIKDGFGELVSGRDLWIFGPAAQDSVRRPKKDDLIVRMEFVDKANLPECERDINTDISYYNIEHCERIFGNNGIVTEDTLENTKAFRMKSQIDSKITKGIHKNKFGCIFQFFAGVTFGHGNMVPIAIFDLLHYHPASIFVTGTTLYYTSKYKNGYISSDLMGDIERYRALCSHDLVGQFIYMRSLYRRGLIKVDEELKKILELSEKDYSRGIQSISLRARQEVEL